MEESIEVGPSFADEDGKIRKEFVFRPDTSIEQQATVTPTRLAISNKAKKEFQKAQNELGKKNTEKAIKHLKNAIEESPQFSTALNRLGTIYFHQREFLKAESYFTRALEAEPDSYPPLVNLCAAQFALRRIQESLECNLEAVAKEPEDPLARSQLGQSYFVLGQFDRSEKELLEAARLDPSHFTYPQMILGEIYRIRGDDASLVRVLEEFIELHPDLAVIPQLREVVKTKKQVMQESNSDSSGDP
jgi:tetratricopeptide (TPR) repeat protein